MKVLVIGSGGREHALVWKIAQSPKVDEIYCTPGNPGIGKIAKNIPNTVDQLRTLVKFAKKEKIDLTIVGPEIPLVAGVVDLFRKNNLAIIGPTQKAAQIEGSKVFAKKLMKKYDIPTAKFEAFREYKKARSYLKSQDYPLVIKADGVSAGKGVAVCKNHTDALKFLKKLMRDKIFGNSGNNVVIEECLFGQEVSFMAATDGSNFITLLPSQDHKRVFENDKGPNTGGMGAYAPIPWVSKTLILEVEDQIIQPTIKALKKEGSTYSGILYPGIILTKDGPKVLEFNCRFGDPETQPVLSLLKSDIIDLFLAIVQKKINKIKIKWYKGSAICVVLTSKGYPEKYKTDQEIFGLDKLNNKKNIYAFQSGTKFVGGKVVTSGGRVLGITAQDKNLLSAIKKAYKYIGKAGIHFSGMHYRKDIGKKGLKLFKYTI